MKIYGTISVDGIAIDWKQTRRKNGKQLLTARGRDGDILECEKIDLFDTAARERFAAALGDQAEVDAEAVNKALMQVAADLAADDGEDVDVDVDDPGEAVEPDPLDSMPREVQEEGRAMLESPDLMETIAHDVMVAGVAGEDELTKTLYLGGTSRLLAKPVSVIVQGSTSSGKSYVIQRVASLFPQESTLDITQMTPNAFFYLPPGTLKHRWVVAGERSRREDKHTAEATRALREMLSSGQLKKMLAKKSGEGYVTEVITQAGPIAYTESTTLTQFFAEDANRMLMLHTDEQVRQTQRVIDQLGRAYSSGNAQAERDRVIAKHHAAQRMLKQYDVVIPFANRLSRRFPSDRVEARRGFPQLMSMIQAVCLLHQFQRETDEHGRLVATEADYRIARELLLKPLDRLLRGRVSDQAAGFLERLKQRVEIDEVFTREQAARGESRTQRTIEMWLKELHEAGLVQQVMAASGPRAATWRLPHELDRAEDSKVLPTVEDIFGPEEFAELLMAS